MLYNIALFSAKHQHESAISPLSSKSLLPPSQSQPSILLQSPNLSSLSPIANFHWLSILHMIVYMLFHSYTLTPTLSFLSSPSVHKSILCLCLHCCSANLYFLNFIQIWLLFLWFHWFPNLNYLCPPSHHSILTAMTKHLCVCM